MQKTNPPQINAVFKLFIYILLFAAISCSPLRQIHKIQSDKRIKHTENLNFIDSKVVTQWWYYDCVFEDGSVLVILFTPYQWWDDVEKMPTNNSLFYLSYMNSNGDIISQRKVFNVSEIQYDTNSIKSPCFEIIKAHENNCRNYTVNFFLDSIKGDIKICSNEKGFSPFPRGSMSSTLTYLFKNKTKGLAYRYAAHVTDGQVNCSLDLKQKKLELTGKAYLEQGWFTGSPDQMGNGWTWFHFVSKNVNIFGTAEQFFCLEKQGTRLIGGLDKKCSVSEMTYSSKYKNLLTRGTLSFHTNKLSFNLCPVGNTATPIIVMPSIDTDQIWGSVLQETALKFRYKKNELDENGVMFLETCRMKKKE